MYFFFFCMHLLTTIWLHFVVQILYSLSLSFIPPYPFPLFLGPLGGPPVMRSRNGVRRHLLAHPNILSLSCTPRVLMAQCHHALAEERRRVAGMTKS